MHQRRGSVAWAESNRHQCPVPRVCLRPCALCAVRTSAHAAAWQGRQKVAAEGLLNLGLHVQQVGDRSTGNGGWGGGDSREHADLLNDETPALVRVDARQVVEQLLAHSLPANALRV